MERDATDADLVIVIGTSLGGLNADQVATNCAQRSLRGISLGTVCINLQQTPEDASMSLRLFGKSDAILAKVIARLNFLGEELPALKRLKWKRRRALVPYDKDGNLLPKDSKEPKMWWDLNDEADVKICSHNNIQGSRQARYGHIFAERPKYKYKGATKGTFTGDAFATYDFLTNADETLTVVVDGSDVAITLNTNFATVAAAASGMTIAGATVAVDGSNLKITSDSTGTSSTIAIKSTSGTNAIALFGKGTSVAGAASVMKLRGDGVGKIESRVEDVYYRVAVNGSIMSLGCWWMLAARLGEVKQLPIVNVNPLFEENEK